MNEQAPNQLAETHLAEQRVDGRREAESAIAAIEGFNQMDYREKYAVLAELLQQFNTQEGRFAVEHIAAMLKAIELAEDINQKDAQLSQIRDYYAVNV